MLIASRDTVFLMIFRCLSESDSFAEYGNPKMNFSISNCLKWIGYGYKWLADPAAKFEKGNVVVACAM